MMFKKILPLGVSRGRFWGKLLKQRKMPKTAKAVFFAQMLAFLLVFLGVTGLSGCHLVPPLPAANLKEPGWTVREGQAVWRQKADAPEIAGEFLIASREDGRAFVQFTKTPFPMVTAQKTANSWEIEIPIENKRYSGRGQPPKRIIWLQLPALLAGGTPPTGWSWTPEGSHWRLENSATGEALEGYFTQ